MTRVGLVVVSHSARLADGVVEVAAQMAPDVRVVAAGGTEDGGIGTDFDAVSAALGEADGGAGVVVLYDLGSARMVAEMAVESASGAVLVDAPLVEGAVAAAVAAQNGAGTAEVADAARAAANPEAEEEPAPEAEDEEEVRVTLTNEIGLHARPAALVARRMSEVDAKVTVRFNDTIADGRSVLALMALRARGGDEVRVSASGPHAAEALRAFQDLAARDFDE
ncbi:dihydroxyacetone kinase phosphoryl donor subunit DhaM [Actinophytocola sp.]|uniref:dihydroxyacetone kinase phosphoryl donor subunit DhaM n=1 Tax=Actinophytocola sp. TaxID=1872138 RepID=UPI0025C33E9E|nr:dihydroxyacetone kinase phosphoryl donor subunit DhaM [Actinophytocola sp.]